MSNRQPIEYVPADLAQRELPAAPDAEQAMLGSVLLNRDAMIAIAPWFQAAYMSQERHRLIYEAMRDCYSRRVPPDTRMLAEQLRARGSLEQDSDNVWFLYREELHDPETDKRGIAELHISKHRQGPVGVAPMRFDAATTRFDDLSYRTVEGY